MLNILPRDNRRKLAKASMIDDLKFHCLLIPQQVKQYCTGFHIQTRGQMFQACSSIEMYVITMKMRGNSATRYFKTRTCVVDISRQTTSGGITVRKKSRFQTP